MRSYTKAYRSLDFTVTKHKPAPGDDVNKMQRVAILRNASPDQACTYYNELVKPDGVNVAANWVPFDADGNVLFGGRSGIDMANRYFPCIAYSSHPLN